MAVTVKVRKRTGACRGCLNKTIAECVNCSQPLCQKCQKNISPVCQPCLEKLGVCFKREELIEPDYNTTLGIEETMHTGCEHDEIVVLRA